MSSKLHQILSISLFLYITLNSSVIIVGQECPYPCYPPPIGVGTGTSTGTGGGGGGNNPPKTTFPPPSQTGYNPTPIFPYNPPNNPNYYGSGQPPPDPVVPWFPYYYKKPPHSTDQTSSTCGRLQSTIMIFLINFLVFSLL
ncbi:uncharacterized protein LOC143598736 [Bidens hawaiensis]|uniref:uncharacterized protein LOC143598736 n=1 Tax=Bidens hawaiensis TaxID=980011 RepID=UPI00404B0B21